MMMSVFDERVGNYDHTLRRLHKMNGRLFTLSLPVFKVAAEVSCCLSEKTMLRWRLECSSSGGGGVDGAVGRSGSHINVNANSFSPPGSRLRADCRTICE